MTWMLLKLGLRLVAFTAVFWFATRPRRDRSLPKDKAPVKPPRISIQPRWAIVLVGFLFAGLNTLLYWILRPVLDLATLRMFSLVMPLVVNAMLLWGTVRIVGKKQWIKIDGWLPALWMVGALSLAHGALWLSLDFLPSL